MNLDAHLSRVEAGQYVDGRNFVLYVGKDKKAFIPRKFRGTKQIAFNAPAGVNTGIGTYWDETGDTLISFIHNDQGNHFILWMFPKEPTARVIEIPQLNLQIGKPVVGCAFINQELLIFTDGGDYPKCINLPRADDTNKKSIVRLHLPPTTGILGLNSRVLAVQLTLNGVAQGFAIPLAPANSQQLWDFQPQFSHFAAQFNGNTSLAAAFTARSCAEFLEFEATQVGMWSLTGIVTDTIGGVPQPSVNAIVEYWNRYNNPFTDGQVRLARVIPKLAPSAVLAFDPVKTTNQIEGRVFQFQYAFRFKDKDRSLTGPISDIALPSTSQCQNGGGQYNCVDVGFNDPWLSDPAMRGEIEFIDLFVRNHNDGAWFKFKTLEKWEWIYSRSYRFFNDGTYTASDQAYNEAGNTYVPPIANTLEALVDADDNTRILLAGIKEGDDNPCVEVVLSPRMDGSVGATGGTASVTGKIWIVAGFDTSSGAHFSTNQAIQVYDEAVGPTFGGMGNTTHTNNPQNWNQKIPMGGWPVYLADTDLFTISTQVVPTIFVSGTGGSGTVSPTLWNAPVGSPAAGRNVYDATRTGDAGNPANQTHRAAMRVCMEFDSVHSTFTLSGLVPGQTYVLRLASHKCFTGPGTDIYDLNSTNRAWQRTSTRVAKCGTVNNSVVKSGRTEITITVPSTGAGTTIDVGDIYVVDFTNPNIIVGSTAIEGYLFDDEGANYSASNDIRETGVSAEKQLIALGNYIGGSPIGGAFGTVGTPLSSLNLDMLLGRTYSDHNGYFFAWRLTIPLVHPRAAWITVGGTPGLSGTIGAFTPTTVTVTNFTILCNINEEKWEGDLSTPTLTVSYSGNLPAASGVTELIIPNHVDIAEHRRTTITLRVLTLQGTPIMGVSAVLENGRARRSGGDGTISLIAYSDVITNNDDRVVDNLILRGSGPCNTTFPNGGVIDIQITQFEAGNEWSDTVPYEIGDILGIIAGVGRGRGYKRGGSYGVAYYLGRDNGDRTAAKPLMDVNFPVLTKDLHDWMPLAYPVGTFSPGIGVIGWQINGPVPRPWIGRWDFIQFVVTWDNSSVFMVQWLASQVVYSSIWDEATDEPTDAGGYGNGNATEVYIALTDSFVRYGEMHSDARQNFGTTIDDNTGYLWEQGDMLRILTNKNQVPIYGTTVEVKITGQRGRYITIQATGSVPELFGGEVIEIFRPRKPTEGSLFTYYDIPDGRIMVVDPLGANPTWAQTSGTLDKGDTWIVPRQVPIRPSTTLVPANPWSVVNSSFESKWISDFYPSTDWGQGKPWFQDPDAAVQDRGVLMRYTDSYKPGTNINGLNFVGGLNFRIVENWLGPIRKMERIGDVIFVVCENGAFSVYVAIEQLQTTPDAVVQTAGGILGTIRPFAHKFGCIDPMTVVRATTNIMYFSRATGAMVQYNSNQLQDLAEQNDCSTYFQDKATTVSSDTKICGGYDMIHKEVIFSFGPHIYDDGTVQIEIDGESLKYFDPGNAFTAKLDASPDFWGKTRGRLWSFFDGKLWEHHVTDRYNEIYGQNVPMKLKTPFIPGWSLNHQWKNVTFRGSGGNWEATVESLTGETFTITADMFKHDEIYDTASIDGKISGAEITVEMIHERNGYAELIALWTNQKMTGMGGQLG